MKEIFDEHRAADKFIERVWAANPKLKPCCKAGCSACCSESVYVSEAEALHIIEMLTPDQVEDVKARLPEWISRTKPLMSVNMPDAMAYRRLNAPCVFLKAGLCSIYERRPFGCRQFFALQNPDDCDLPNRKHQKFAVFGTDLFRAVGSITAVNDKVVVDHLGVFLAELLMGIKIESGSRRENHASEFRQMQ